MNRTAGSNRLTELEHRAIAWLLFLSFLTATVWLAIPSRALAATSHSQQNDSVLFTGIDLVTGTQDFAKQITIPTPSSLNWGDFDDDGKLDILISGFTSVGAIAGIWRNNGDGTFHDIVAGLPDMHDCSVAWGDFDNDGDLDIVLTGDTGSGNISRIYRNDGGGSFTDASAGLIGVAHGAVACGDFDNDGDLVHRGMGQRV